MKRMPKTGFFIAALLILPLFTLVGCGSSVEDAKIDLCRIWIESDFEKDPEWRIDKNELVEVRSRNGGYARPEVSFVWKNVGGAYSPPPDWYEGVRDWVYEIRYQDDMRKACAELGVEGTAS